MKKIVLLVFLGVFIIGCKGIPLKNINKLPPDVQTQPAVGSFYNPPLPSEGSLWTDSANLLFTDSRARRVGDTVIIDIVENTSSTMEANTKASRTSSVGVGISDLMGIKRNIVRRNPTFDVNDKLISGSFTNSLDGKGSIDRSGQVTASIAARVTEVFPNGNIRIYGKREMRVNNETQYIVVSGTLRPQDIESTNRVRSTFLADSKIEYSGRGVLADKQKSGWFARIIDNLWPF